jgi:hypothetical protein
MEVPPTRCTIWNKLADLLVRVSCKSSGYEEAYAAVLRLATNLQSTHFAASVAYAAKNSMSSSVRPDDALGLTAFVNSDGIPPWTLQFLSTDGRLQAVEILESQIGGCASLRDLPPEK